MSVGVPHSPRSACWAATHRHEMGAAATSGLISFAVYLWSAAPNVTLLDSGEFIVAAQHFGVPHPTGYPLWTILAWLFQLLPLGNAAWEINLFSGFCGALAVAMASAILTNLLRWFLGDSLAGSVRLLPFFMGVSFSLMLAFSVSMWSQATIAEVYTLHALAVAVYLALLYGWVRHPAHDKLMLWAFFVLALSFSNHHLTLTLAPLPYLLILLLRRRALPDWIFAGTLTLLLGYLGFAILSQDLRVLKTAIRLFWIVAAAGSLFVILRRGKVRWKLVALLPLAVGAGLLPYAYMPFASSTNPPMNWGYAREQSGFFYSINRSQYAGSLSDQSLRLLGTITGTSGLERAPDGRKPADLAPKTPGTRRALQLWIGFFWQKLSAAFTPFSLIGYFASIVFILRYPLPQRTWIYCLHFAFVLAAFLQPIVDGAKVDQAGWWLQMPFHTYTNLIYALLSGLGTGLLLAKMTAYRPVYFWLAPVALILPVFTFLGSEPVASQRERWFGWQYGHDMLKDLPKDTVVIGGTDPGRFVPTYMIFGESTQLPKHKRDPEFDRRDLYIITQNALGDPFYMDYIRDHYGVDRPEPSSTLEHWLGRPGTYPEKPLVLPDEEEVKEILRTVREPDPQTGLPAGGDPTFAVFSSVLRWIWERNRDEHEFFIEESFPISWSYDYAVPEGLIYRLSREKLDSLPEEVVRRDFEFWADYKERLLAHPAYAHDLDAQRSFSKLRHSIANIYNHREMTQEAERAYREALELWPASVETLAPLSGILVEQGRFVEAMELIQQAFDRDPNNESLVQLASFVKQREEADTRIRALRTDLERDPADVESLESLLSIYASIGDTNRTEELVSGSLVPFSTNARALKALVQFADLAGLTAEHTEAARLLVETDPGNAASRFFYARALMRSGQTNEAFHEAQGAIEVGGRRMREAVLLDPAFSKALTEEPFKSLMGPAERLPGSPSFQPKP